MTLCSQDIEEGLKMALLVDIPMAAETLGGISATTVRRLIASGELPVVRVGRRIMIEERAIVAWIERVKGHDTATEKAEEAHHVN
jgi:excisionase family DNA binding protein